MTKDEALKLALEALDDMHIVDFPLEDLRNWNKAMTAIKQALAQPEQEPVARVIDNGTPEGATEWIPFANRVEPLKTGDLLYGEPPQRTWVGLTDEERESIQSATLDLHGIPKFFATAIEAKLKDKNT